MSIPQTLSSLRLDSKFTLFYAQCPAVIKYLQKKRLKRKGKERKKRERKREKVETKQGGRGRRKRGEGEQKGKEKRCRRKTTVLYEKVFCNSNIVV